MRHLRLLLVALALLLAPVRTLAWNEPAHLVIAHIAYSRLNPVAAARVDELAGLLNFRNERYTRITIGSYMDDLRGDPFYDNLRPWHFYDRMFPEQAGNPPIEEPNLLTQTKQMIDLLKKGGLKPEEEAQYLAYLIHLVGDAHQPLHCATRRSASHPDGDAGGNVFFIKGEFKSLHAFWDVGGGLYNPKDISYPLDSLGMEKIRGLAYDATSENLASKQGWQDLNPETWLNESFIIAEKFAYTTLAYAPPSPAYQKETQKICRTRVAWAGYRLAAILNNILTAPQTPAQKTPQQQVPMQKLRRRASKP